MEEGFVEANSDILPKVSVDMIVRFLAASTEIKCSGESYGDNAIRFVQLRRAEGVCTVRGRVTPEHAISAESYRVTAAIDEDEGSVQACHCEDCAACPDACRHAAAFLLWLHRRSEAPATSTTSYWEPDPGPSPEDMKPCITLKEMLGIKESTEDHSDLTVFNEFMKEAKERNIDCPLVRHYQDNKQVLGLHRLCASLGGALRYPRALLLALTAEMTNVEESDVTPWPEIWYGRIKDSMLHEAVHCPELKSDLVDRILSEDLQYTAEELDRRNTIKKAVLEDVSRKEKIEITEAGVLLNAEYPILGAAPEGVAEEYTVEVKCPTTNETLLSYVKDNKLTMELWTQVQAQMYFSKKRKALLCVAQPDYAASRRVEVFHVPFYEGIVRVLDGAQQFWIDSVFPELLEIYKS